MSVLSVVSVALSFVAAHPTETVLAVTAAASLAVKPLESRLPWLSRVCAVASQFGVNIPGIVEQLKAKAPAVVAEVAAAEAKKLEGK